MGVSRMMPSSKESQGRYSILLMLLFPYRAHEGILSPLTSGPEPHVQVSLLDLKAVIDRTSDSQGLGVRGCHAPHRVEINYEFCFPGKMSCKSISAHKLTFKSINSLKPRIFDCMPILGINHFTGENTRDERRSAYVLTSHHRFTRLLKPPSIADWMATQLFTILPVSHSPLYLSRPIHRSMLGWNASIPISL